MQVGLLPVLKEADTPLMVNTKKNIGDDKSAAALRKLFSILLASIPNLVVNAAYRTQLSTQFGEDQDIFG